MRFTGGKVLLLSMLGLASAGAAPAFAGFVGTTATVNYDWPSIGTVQYPGGSAAVVPGGTTFSMSSGGALADVADSSISITFPTGWGFNTTDPKTFDGVVITDPGVDITGVSLGSSNIPAYVVGDLSSDANDVFIDFPLPFSSLATGATLVVDVTFAPVPEPASLAVLSAGLLGIATGRLRRRRA